MFGEKLVRHMRKLSNPESHSSSSSSSSESSSSRTRSSLPLLPPSSPLQPAQIAPAVANTTTPLKPETRRRTSGSKMNTVQPLQATIGPTQLRSVIRPKQRERRRSSQISGTTSNGPIYAEVQWVTASTYRRPSASYPLETIISSPELPSIARFDSADFNVPSTPTPSPPAGTSSTTSTSPFFPRSILLRSNPSSSPSTNPELLPRRSSITRNTPFDHSPYARPGNRSSIASFSSSIHTASSFEESGRIVAQSERLGVEDAFSSFSMGRRDSLDLSAPSRNRMRRRSSQVIDFGPAEVRQGSQEEPTVRRTSIRFA